MFNAFALEHTLSKQPKSHNPTGATGNTKHKSLKLDDALLSDVEEWRATQRPIPSLSDALRTLLARGLRPEKGGDE